MVVEGVFGLHHALRLNFVSSQASSESNCRSITALYLFFFFSNGNLHQIWQRLLLTTGSLFRRLLPIGELNTISQPPLDMFSKILHYISFFPVPYASPSGFCGARIGLLALFEYIVLLLDDVWLHSR